MSGKLFSALPSEIFRVFSGSQAEEYADLLELLYRDLYYSSGLYPRSEVVAAIRHAIRDGDGSETKANQIYARLVETGWLNEYVSNYTRLSDMSPEGRALAEFLVSLKERSAVSYAGEVITVLSLLEGVVTSPEQRYHALFSAATASRNFLNHLRGLASSLRVAEELLTQKKDFVAMMKSFLDDYVEKFLISDIKTLHTTGSPFRYRVKVLALVSTLGSDESVMSAMEQAVAQAQFGGDLAAARSAIGRALSEISDVFGSIDGYLTIIDETNRRVEQRIKTSVRFLEELKSSRIALIEACLKGLGTLGAEEIPEASAAPGLPQSSVHLFQPQRRRSPPAVQAIERYVKDPEQVAREEALRAYFRRSAVRADDLEAFILQKIGRKEELRASEIDISNLDEFFLFERLRLLEFLDGGVLGKRWQISRLNSNVENGWIRCRDFTISYR